MERPIRSDAGNEEMAMPAAPEDLRNQRRRLPRGPASLGGKLCTKFVNGKEDPTLHFDMGVQVLKPRGRFAEELEGVVKPWPRVGRFKRIRCTGDWRRWSIQGSEDLPTTDLVVGTPSMSAIGRHLAERCRSLEVHVDRTAQVQGRRKMTGQWSVMWSRAEANAGQLRYRPELAEGASEVSYRNFDAVVLAFEANKVLHGCKSGYKMVPSSVSPALRERLSGRTKTSQVWNLMVAFDRELPMPWDAAAITGHGSLAWVAVDSSKPDRQRVPQCFMIFSTKEWANWKQWSKKEVERVLLYDFMSFLSDTLGSWPPEPCFLLSGRWGNNTEAVLTGEVPEGDFPMRSLGHYEGVGSPLWDKDGMGATGDWARGFSVNDAYSAGVELAEKMLEDLGEGGRLAGG
ncbi:unnamed protein product [Durusdinium trenchii]|uniref:Amine oxidase n=1 Tax=Durusdinium trenchii TaxID=1381693 RepID=A0ABP0I502_9DINO